MDARLKIWHRLALLVSGILVFVIGVIVLVASFQFKSLPISVEGEGFFTSTRLIMLLIGAVAIFISAFLFTLPHKIRGGKHDYVVQKTPTGEMRISVSAIESIVQKSLAQHSDIKMQNMRVNNQRGGVTIDLLVDLPNNINIPLALASLQKHIKRQLNATSGIDAKEVRISVKEAETTAKSSPYLVTPEELAFEPLTKSEIDKTKNIASNANTEEKAE